MRSPPMVRSKMISELLTTVPKGTHQRPQSDRSNFRVRDHPSMSFRMEFCVASFGCRSLSAGYDAWQMVRYSLLICSDGYHLREINDNSIESKSRRSEFPGILVCCLSNFISTQEQVDLRIPSYDLTLDQVNTDILPTLQGKVFDKKLTLK
jgi:hypothetical protein